MFSFFSFAEARKFWQIGAPIFIAQLSQTGMTFADTAMTGHYHAEDMAAVALAGSVFAPIALLGAGCLMALPPLSAQMVGGGKPGEAAYLLRQGIWLTCLIATLLLVVFYFLSWHLDSLGLDPVLASKGGSYMRALMWGLPGFMLFVNQRSFYEGFSRTRPAMIVGVLGLALNVPCNYILIYGKLGAPAMGATGCGVASALCYWFMAFCIYWILSHDNQFKSLRPLLSLFRRRLNPDGELRKVFDLHLIWRVLRIGFPGALALFFEVSLFALSALFLAPLGTIVVAGNQAAMNFSALVFMVPMSIGMTVTIRVGYCLGAGKISQARLSAMTGACLAVVCAILLGVAAITFREQVAHIYSYEPEVVELAMQLIFYLAAYQIVDGLQMVGIGVLRGYNDTRIISLICFVTYWVVGLPLCYILARTDYIVPAMGAPGIWLSYLFALGFGAACYWLRIRFLHSLTPGEIFARVNR